MLGLRVTPRHKRSKSFPDNKKVEEDNSFACSLEPSRRIKLYMGQSVGTKKQQSGTNGVHSFLKQEILQLENRLQNQFEVRRALEKALSYRTYTLETTTEISTPKPTTDLIKDIAVLELEVVYLEQYLLSLYRQAFDHQTSSISPPLPTNDERTKTPVATPRVRPVEVKKHDYTSRTESSSIHPGCGRSRNDDPPEETNKVGDGAGKRLDCEVHRCQSTLSHRSALSRNQQDEPLARKFANTFHSQPLSAMEDNKNTSNVISLAEHLGTRISDHVPETPNKLSKDIIKCMAAIYCKLADPPATTNIALSSPSSTLSSASPFSPRDQYDMWSPGLRNNNSSFDVQLENPFHVQGLKEFSGPYNTMVEVTWIYRETQKMGDVELLLQNFRSLITRLEDVDPRKLKHEEKLAFWINVHNALVMHAFLAYGLPQSNVKRFFLLVKASYKIGGHKVSADTIQTSILGCRMSRPAQWLRLLLTSRKFKTEDQRQAYAIEHPEPLVHFALCAGSHSDPAVRVYTPKRVIQELETSKEEYIRATFGVGRDRKLLLPKLVESFAKSSSLSPLGIVETIQQSLPESLRKSVKKCRRRKSKKFIEWAPHNFGFRYLISKELLS